MLACIEQAVQKAGRTSLRVDARRSSQTCAACEYCDKRNRESQAKFQCRDCGHRDNADENAAKVIGQRGHKQRLAAKAGLTQPVAGAVVGGDAQRHLKRRRLAGDLHLSPEGEPSAPAMGSAMSDRESRKITNVAFGYVIVAE